MTDRDDLILTDEPEIEDDIEEIIENVDEAVEETAVAEINDSHVTDQVADDSDQAAAPDDHEPQEDPEVAATESLEWQQSTGAYVLGVMDPADSALAAASYITSPTLQAELKQLIPVADILTSLYQPQVAPVKAPTSDTNVQGSAAEVTVVRSGTKPGRPKRTSETAVIVPSTGRMNSSAILLGVLGLLAAAGLLWALALRDQVSTKDDEIRALRAQVAELQQSTNASAFVLNPTSDTAPDARATVFYSAGDGTVLIDVSGLPELDDDQVYQVWLQTSDSDSWQPGPTFRVNSQGDAVRRLAGETPGFQRMAVSAEPSPGSTEPSGEFLLEGELVVSTE